MRNAAIRVRRIMREIITPKADHRKKNTNRRRGGVYFAEFIMPTDPITSVFPGGMFDGYNILAGLLFGAIGMVSLNFGRKMQRWKPVAIGLSLMIYPYFVYNRWLLWGIGSGLLATLWFHHDE